ncbi:MAG: hypothetical protein KAJ55_17100 [Anaerolineales bacterium]|nr:hypothetical protein [Anaerolineales bacterium]
MKMCGIDEYKAINAYDPTKEEIDTLADVYKMVISKGCAERVSKYYDSEIIEVGSTTFNDLIDASRALEGTYDKIKAEDCIERLEELKERYASKALVISKRVQPDYETSSEGVEVGKDADILVPTHRKLEGDLIERVCMKYDTIIDGLKDVDN